MIGRKTLVQAALATLLSAGPAAADGGNRFGAVAGDWTGTVSEIGLPHYRVRLTLAPDGSGRAVYPDFPCTARLAPAPGAGMRLGETVTKGRERCADGTVELVPADGALRWLWRDRTGTLRAASTLAPAD